MKSRKIKFKKKVIYLRFSRNLLLLLQRFVIFCWFLFSWILCVQNLNFLWDFESMGKCQNISQISICVDHATDNIRNQRKTTCNERKKKLRAHNQPTNQQITIPKWNEKHIDEEKKTNWIKVANIKKQTQSHILCFFLSACFDWLVHSFDDHFGLFNPIN